MKVNINKILIMLLLFLTIPLFFSYALKTPTPDDELMMGYIIEVNEDNTYIIDLGDSHNIKLDDEFVIYAHDKIVEHPIHGNEYRVPGREMGKGIVKDVYEKFSVITMDPTSIKSKKPIEPGFSVKLIKSDVDDFRNKFRKIKRRKANLKKSITTVQSSFSTGYFGGVSVLNEDFYVGYKFPTRLNIFRFEIQVSQFLYLLDIYDPLLTIQPVVHAFTNIVFHFEIWQHKDDNGGIGVAFGGGFTQTGFAGNAGFIIGNMNKTGLSVYFYGLLNRSISTEINLSIFLFSKKHFGLNLDSRLFYSYWFDKNDRIEHGIKFHIGPSFRIGEYVYLNAFGGITNTMSQDFGGIGGMGIKLVF